MGKKNQKQFSPQPATSVSSKADISESQPIEIPLLTTVNDKHIEMSHDGSVNGRFSLLVRL
jgi:hypothetical protein